MDVSIHWEKDAFDPSSRVAKIQLRPYLHPALEGGAFSTESGKCLTRIHIESFCTSNYHITATYDSSPLTSLRTLVTTPALLCRSDHNVPRVRKFCYKRQSEQSYDEHYQDCLFSSIDTSASVASITFASEQKTSGVLCRIELDDGSLLEHFDECEYFVGCGKRRFPYSLEIPVSWPLERQIRSEQVLSLYRSNLFWLQPQPDCRDLNNILHETNFVLVGLDVEHGDGFSKDHEDNDFACLMVTREPQRALRSTMFSTGTYPAIRVETSCGELLSIDDLADVVVCHFATGPDPFSAVRATVEAHSLRTRAFSSRCQKLSSPRWQSLSTKAKILNRLGYCTWDAVGHKCSNEYVISALKWLGDKKIPVSYVVIDDGWQDGGSSGPLSEDDRMDEPSPKLTSFHANDKFPASLRSLSAEGKPAVYVWMAAIGYWGGTDGTCFEGETIHVTLKASIGLQKNRPNHTKMWEREYEIMAPTAENLEGFFTDYFKALSAQGVTCVKIDGQSILGSFTSSSRNISAVVGEYRAALQRAAERVFPEEVILNSMACAQEVMLNSGHDLSVANACWRTSDDHSFPEVEETDGMVAWHVLRNAMNGLFLGEIFTVTDWDMFRVSDQNSYIHAVARVLSGGPVYISDAIPFNGELEGAVELVRRLTTSDGRILRCHDPGRPTADCVFGDPRQGRMFKVFNRNAVSGVVGLFNLSTRGTGHQVRDDYCPGDVEDLRRGPGNGFISVVVGAGWRCAFRHDGRFAKQGISLWPMEGAIAHVYPILKFPGGVEVVAVGRLDLLNCGGVVKCVTAWKCEDDGSTVVELSLADYGRIAVWLGHEAASRLRSVSACEEQQDMAFMTIDELSFLSVTAPESYAEEEISVRMTFESLKADS